SLRTSDTNVETASGDHLLQSHPPSARGPGDERGRKPRGKRITLRDIEQGAAHDLIARRLALRAIRAPAWIFKDRAPQEEGGDTPLTSAHRSTNRAGLLEGEPTMIDVASVN
ncbi:hypothetical protein WG901_23770, partial [Novosphingobium sp. PS1R-30]